MSKPIILNDDFYRRQKEAEKQKEIEHKKLVAEIRRQSKENRK